MVGLIVLAKLLAGTMEARLHGCNAGFERFCNLSMTAPLLHKGKKHAILGSELGNGIAEGVQFLRVDGAQGLGHILVLGREWKKDPAQLLPAQVVNARVAGQAEKPGFKLRGGLKAV
jgi:hypothetical protein